MNSNQDAMSYLMELGERNRQQIELVLTIMKKKGMLDNVAGQGSRTRRTEKEALEAYQKHHF